MEEITGRDKGPVGILVETRWPGCLVEAVDILWQFLFCLFKGFLKGRRPYNFPLFKAFLKGKLENGKGGK